MFIVGIDPGTTVAYAILNLKGEVVEFSSMKECSADELTTILIKKGTYFLVATDKVKTPSFVKALSISLASEVYLPKEEMRVKYKQMLTKDISYNNSHERDALSAALLAYDSCKERIKKIQSFIATHNAEYYHDEFFRQVIKNPSLTYEQILFRIKKEKTRSVPEKKQEKKIPEATVKATLHRFQKENTELRNELKSIRSILQTQQRELKKKLQKHERELSQTLKEKYQKQFAQQKKKADHVQKLYQREQKEKAYLLSLFKRKEEYIPVPVFSSLSQVTNAQTSQVVYVEQITSPTKQNKKKLNDSDFLVLSSMQCPKNIKNATASSFKTYNKPLKKVGNLFFLSKKEYQGLFSNEVPVERIISEYQSQRKKGKI